jgi:hypothetical protein
VQVLTAGLRGTGKPENVIRTNVAAEANDHAGTHFDVRCEPSVSSSVRE